MSIHWAEPYIGRPYIEGGFDCADLVVLVMAEQFGHPIKLPSHAASLRGRDAQINTLKGDFARPLKACEPPEEGDALLMRALGRRQPLGHHIGIWCKPANEPHILHCLKGIGVCLHPLRSLKQHGLEATGVYRWL